MTKQSNRPIDLLLDKILTVPAFDLISWAIYAYKSPPPTSTTDTGGAIPPVVGSLSASIGDPTPFISIGPSGIGGPYQWEICE
jgi:hypothetical protein